MYMYMYVYMFIYIHIHVHIYMCMLQVKRLSEESRTLHKDLALERDRRIAEEAARLKAENDFAASKVSVMQAIYLTRSPSNMRDRVRYLLLRKKRYIDVWIYTCHD